MKRISTALLGGAVFGTALLVACGGGGGTSSAGPSGIPPVATSAPATGTSSFTNSDAVAIPAPAPGAVSVPVPLTSDSSGASAAAALPSNGIIPADTTVASTYSTAADSTLPALSRGRSTQGRTVREDVKKDVIAYLRMQFSADVTLPQAPSFSFVVPRTLATTGVTYWLYMLDPLRTAAGWQQGFEGPAIVTATTANGKAATQLAFASNGQPVSFSANQTYYFAVVAVPATAATPTPVPSSVPSNPPHDSKPASVGVTPRDLQFASVTSSPAPITFVEPGFSGPFTLHGDCTGIVNTSGTSPTFTVTPVGPGRCVIVGLGDRGATAVVHVGVVTGFETPRPSSSPTTQPSHSPEPTHAPTTAPSTAPSHSPEPTQAPVGTPTSAPSHSPEPTQPPGTSVSPTPGPNATLPPK